MDLNKTLEVLDALAAGCSPMTGESINDSVLNERVVIRALQNAIDLLRNNSVNNERKVEISETDLNAAIQFFRARNQNPTSHKLMGFFLGVRKFKNNHLVSNQFYGKYKGIYSEGQLLDYFDKYISDNNLSNKIYNELMEENDFFRIEKFNKLSINAINQLKEKVNELGVVKIENLSETVLNARSKHSRAFEPWSEKEKTLLRKALEYTNDLDLLSICFQRGRSSIESYGLRLIIESKPINNNEIQDNKIHNIQDDQTNKIIFKPKGNKELI